MKWRTGSFGNGRRQECRRSAHKRVRQFITTDCL